MHTGAHNTHIALWSTLEDRRTQGLGGGGERGIQSLLSSPGSHCYLLHKVKFIFLPISGSSNRDGIVTPAWGKGKGVWDAQMRCFHFSSQVQTLRPENLLFVATLDGSLHALNKQTGDLEWTVKDGEQGISVSP